MLLMGQKLYEVLERCNDLFPQWKKEGDQYWNSKTGEIIKKDGTHMHDLVFRGYEDDIKYETNSENSQPTLNSISITGPLKPEHFVTDHMINGSCVK